MAKKIIIPKSISQVKTLLSKIDGIIIGLKDFCVNFESSFDISELKEIIKICQGKEVFVSLNKNIFNSELKVLEKNMIDLSTLSIKGVLFYDVAILNIYHRHHFAYDLIWNQEHFTVNGLTANYYIEEGVRGVYISSDITKEEVNDFVRNISAYTLLNIFGHLPMFVSRRHLVKNYQKTFALQYEGEKYFLQKEDKFYPVIDDENGTYVYSAHILNGARNYMEFVNMGIEYFVLNSFNISLQQFSGILDLFSMIDDENAAQIYLLIDKHLSGKTDEGFLNTPTIFKIKKGVGDSR